MRPVRVAVDSQHEVLRRGVEGLLGEQPERVVVVAVPPPGPGVEDSPVIVYDAVRIHDEHDDGHLRQLVGRHRARVVAIAPHFRPDLSHRAVAAGACAVVTYAVTAAQLVDIVEVVGRGADGGPVPHSAGAVEALDPGFGAGLTEREAQILTRVARGLSNQEIADQMFLSTNTVKTYIRGAYRKIGATSRSQAVLWALTQGVAP